MTNVTNPSGTNESYNFDDVGNRISSHRSANYGYQPFNKVVSTATANYVYDANGNMVSKSEGTNFWRYGFDYENRLVSASTRRETIRYRYDALGRRVQRYFRGTKENAKFIYDGQDVLVDDNAGTLTKYINGEGIDNKLRVQTGSNVNYFLADHLGSTNGLADGSGNLTASTNYDAFGNASNVNFPTRYQFTGREHDNFTGLHYYRARFYDANLGRFISEDPIGFAGGEINLYGYVQNNPAMMRDPSGKIPILIPIVIGAGALILSSPSYVNAPGPGDPVYDSRSDVVANAVMGAAGGYVLRIVGGAIFGAVSSKLCKTGGSSVDDVGDDFITLYRGDSPGTSVIKSQAARHGGYEYSKNLLKNGNADDLMKKHAYDSSNPPSPFISASKNPEVAAYFAGPNGIVNQLRVPLNRASPNPHNNMFVEINGRLVSESEYLIPHYIRPSEIIR